MSHSGHGHDEMSQYGGIPGGHDMYDEGGHSEPRMTKLQIFMGRQIYRWPLYSIVISLGQLLSAVSPLFVSLPAIERLTTVHRLPSS